MNAAAIASGEQEMVELRRDMRVLLRDGALNLMRERHENDSGLSHIKPIQ